jgi:hypothetical protein
MRIGEKIIHYIVNSALERYKDSKVNCAKRKQLVEDLEKCLNTQVFGNPDTGRVSQWSFTWDDGNRRMPKYNMSGVTAGKVMRSLNKICNVLFDETLDQESHSETESLIVREQNNQILTRWSEFAQNLNLMWDFIERNQDFTEEDITKLHNYTATFMMQWIDLTDGNHMINYIHIVGAGHLPYFAKHYGNLYMFSQQGWESLNKLIKHYYNNNTNHGGSSDNGGKEELGNCTNGTMSGQHCYPLMCFCQRFMMWKLGYGDKYFQQIMKKEVVLEVLQSFEEDEVVNKTEGFQFGII